MSKEIQIRSLLILVLLILVSQGDVVFSFIWEGLHLLVEVVELASEHLLEAHFGLSTRSAQMVTAWLGLAVFLGLLPFIVRKTMTALRRIIAVAADRSKEKLAALQESANHLHPKRWVIAGIVLLAIFSFFF